MKFILASILMFLSVPTLAKVNEVPLTPSGKAALARIYGITRFKADCCGISQVLMYKVESGKVTSDDIQEALEKASLVDDNIKYAYKSELFESRNKVTSLVDFVAFYSKSRLTQDDLSKDVGTLVSDLMRGTGKSFLQIVLSADVQPAPNVDGTVDVAITEKEDVILIRVNDFGS